MKVVLFCGGYGMRIRRTDDDDVPKPMQYVGPRPLLWHVMRYYAHFGHTEFILCLGYGAHHIKKFFLEYAETDNNDFTLDKGTVRLHQTDIADWSITFVDTGSDASIGERMRRVRHLVDDEEAFLANYADVLTDVDLDDVVAKFRESGAAMSMLVVPPQQSFHCVEMGDDGFVTGINPVSEMEVWENGGYMVLTPEAIDRIPPQGEVATHAAISLAAERKLFAYRYKGFWKPADTFKERAELDAAWRNGSRPWAVWEKSAWSRG